MTAEQNDIARLIWNKFMARQGGLFDQAEGTIAYAEAMNLANDIQALSATTTCEDAPDAGGGALAQELRASLQEMVDRYGWGDGADAYPEGHVISRAIKAIAAIPAPVGSPEGESAGLRTIYYAKPVGNTLEEWRDHARKTELYKHGDTVLVWVNEDDLYLPPMAPCPSTTSAASDGE